MNLGQLKTSVQARGFAADTVTSQVEMVNSVYRELYSMREWWWLEASSSAVATVIGTQAYTPSPTTFQTIKRVWLVSAGVEIPLEYLPPHDLRKRTNDNDSNARPKYWSFFNAQIQLYPVPEAVYTIGYDYISRPADLAADGDTPVIPSQYHDVMVWGAVAELSFRERNYEAYNVARTRYVEKLQSMMAFDDQLSQYRQRRGMQPNEILPAAPDIGTTLPTALGQQPQR
jgi:hypothetical protein